MVLSARDECKDYIWGELFQHFNAAFFRKVEEIAHAISDLYCTTTEGEATN